jgi:MFS transporter, SP family, solute carrier family 2 (myo-inositol transporter), member 13
LCATKPQLSPAKYRGALVTVNNLAITVGQFVAYLVDSAFSSHVTGWRYMLGLAAVPAVLQVVGIVLVLPESPRWLVKKNRLDEAADLLRRIRPSASPTRRSGDGIGAGGEREGLLAASVNAPSSSGEERRTTVAEEIAAMQLAASSAGDCSPTGGSSRKKKKNIFAVAKDTASELFARDVRGKLAVGCALQLFQQLSGINTAMYYSPTILQMSGFDSNSAAIWASDAVALANAAFTVVSLFLIDRVGRRTLLLTTMPLYIIALAVLGACFYLDAHPGDANWWNPKWTGVVALVSLICYTAAFAVGMGPVPWAVNAEIYPQHVRGSATGLATFVNWGANLLVSSTFLSLVNWVGAAAAFWLFAGCAALGWVIFIIFLPETANKSMEALQQSETSQTQLTDDPV